jgi:hypothetical protein
MKNKMKHISFTKKTLFIGVPSVLSMIALYLFFNLEDIYFKYNPKYAIFSRLGRIRKEKKARVTHYLDQQKALGEKVSHNDKIINYFKKLHYLYKKNAYNGFEYTLIEHSLNKFFVTELDKFYDILFIDNGGDIFFSIKKEDDFLGNIYEERFNGVSLYEEIRKAKIKDTKFVDYEYYSVSHEPASFFISPVIDGSKIQGYIVLQLPINDLNTILTDRHSLGRTGEVYIVNFKRLMITQSRFIDDSTILTKKIDTEAVRSALKEKKGNKIIEDYRHKRVFSSYEQFDYEGAVWTIIAAIDEDEVITEVYRSREKELFDKVCEYLENYPYPNDRQKVFVPGWKQKNSCIKVDFKEFQKTKNGELLYTEGVATCTALTISYPGKFGYLIHITPTDEVYRNIGLFTKIFLRDRCTDFVGTVMNRINRYDIIQCEKPLLRYGIFATHNSGFKNIIHKLIDNGVELSQIKVLFKKNPKIVDIIFDYREDEVWSLWKGNGFNMTFADEYKHIPDFGEIVMSML